MKQTILSTTLISLLLFACSFVFHIPLFTDYGWGSWIWGLVVVAWFLFLVWLQTGYKIGRKWSYIEQEEIKMLRKTVEYWVEKYREEVVKKEEEE